MQAQVNEARGRFKELGELGPNWTYVGPGEAYVNALKAAGQATDKPAALPDGAIALLRAGKVVRGFVTLQDAVNATQDGDVLEIRSDGAFVGCTIAGVAQGFRKLTIRAGAGYAPTIAGNLGIHFRAPTS